MTKFLHSRYSFILAVLILIACTISCLVLGVNGSDASMDGIILPWSAPWHIPESYSAVFTFCANALAAFMMVQLIKTFNLLRSMTMMPASMFLIMLTATPSLLVTLNPGIMLAITACICFFLMFSSYDSATDCQRSVFLAFFLPSCGAMCSAGFVLLLPMLWLGCAQMRIFTLRTLLASIMGVATPWIIIFGLGIVKPDMTGVPEFYVINAAQSASVLTGLISISALTAFIGIGAWLQNFMKVVSYNAKSRAMLSMLTITMLLSIIVIAIDMSNAYTFIPLLSCMAAMQLGHLFGVIYTQKQSYWAILFIACIYLAIFIWRIAI